MELARGVTLNLALHGPFASFGMSGAHLTVGRSGIRRTVGLPGTGLFYTSRDGWHSGIHSAPHFGQPATARTRNCLSGNEINYHEMPMRSEVSAWCRRVSPLWPSHDGTSWPTYRLDRRRGHALIGASRLRLWPLSAGTAHYAKPPRENRPRAA